MGPSRSGSSNWVCWCCVVINLVTEGTRDCASENLYEITCRWSDHQSMGIQESPWSPPPPKTGFLCKIPDCPGTHFRLGWTQTQEIQVLELRTCTTTNLPIYSSVVFCSFDTGSYFIAQVGLELAILHPSKYCDYSLLPDLTVREWKSWLNSPSFCVCFCFLIFLSGDSLSLN